MSDNKVIKDDFMGYATFNYVEDRRLKAFNRLTTFIQMTGRENLDIAKQYIQEFDKEGRKDIENVYKDIKLHGTSKVRKSIVEGRIYE